MRRTNRLSKGGLTIFDQLVMVLPEGRIDLDDWVRRLPVDIALPSAKAQVRRIAEAGHVRKLFVGVYTITDEGRHYRDSLRAAVPGRPGAPPC